MKFFPLTVESVRHETFEAYTIFFHNPDPAVFTYKPGQYLTLRVDTEGQTYRRAFSLSSSPHGDALLSVTIKAIPGGAVSPFLQKNLKSGDFIEVYPPMGNFFASTNPANAKEYILIGAGSGITPLFSILKSVLTVEKNSKVRLLYGNRTEESIIFRDELAALETKFGGRLIVTYALSSPSASWKGINGRLEGETLEKLLTEIVLHEDLPQEFFLCGPQKMMDGAIATLKAAHVPENVIHREYYSAPVTIEDDEEEESFEIIATDVRILLDGIERTVFVPAGVNILQAVIDAKFDPPFACQEGICSTCRAKLHSGLVQLDFRDGLSDEELQANYILTCQSFPVTTDVFVEFA